MCESAVTHSRTPGAGGPCGVWCPRAWVRHRHPAGVGSCPEEHGSATGQEEWVAGRSGKMEGTETNNSFFSFWPGITNNLGAVLEV